MGPLELNVYRRWESHNSVGGEMWWDHARQLYTLEPARLTPCHPGHPCIPAGRYRITLNESPHLGYVCPLLLDVPGRSEIRIHIANWPMQIKGCTAVGLARDTDAVIDSRKAFALLMRALVDADPVYVTYHDENPPQREIEWTDGREPEQPAAVAADRTS